MFPSNSIADFHGPHFWLDNFSPHSVRWNESLTFPTVEHGFVYFKTLDPAVRDMILQAPDPGEAKYIGRALDLREDWDEIKFGIMCALVTKKFEQHEDLPKRLIRTQGRMLIEGNIWDDNIWGDCICHSCRDILGQNWLGKILMALRAQYLELA